MDIFARKEGKGGRRGIWNICLQLNACKWGRERIEKIVRGEKEERKAGFAKKVSKRLIRSSTILFEATCSRYLLASLTIITVNKINLKRCDISGSGNLEL